MAERGKRNSPKTTPPRRLLELIPLHQRQTIQFRCSEPSALAPAPAFLVPTTTAPLIVLEPFQEILIPILPLILTLRQILVVRVALRVGVRVKVGRVRVDVAFGEGALENSVEYAAEVRVGQVRGRGGEGVGGVRCGGGVGGKGV